MTPANPGLETCIPGKNIQETVPEFRSFVPPMKKEPTASGRQNDDESARAVTPAIIAEHGEKTPEEYA